MEHPLTSPWVISDRRWYEGSIWIGLPPVIIHCNWIFPYEPSSYWGSPMTMETPILNYHIIGFSFTHHLFWGAPMAMESPMTHWWFTPPDEVTPPRTVAMAWVRIITFAVPVLTWLGLALRKKNSPRDLPTYQQLQQPQQKCQLETWRMWRIWRKHYLDYYTWYYCGNQTLLGKYTIYFDDFQRPPFVSEVQLPCFISTG